MTLEEWLGCENEEALWHELARFGDRPLRLFACACLRRVWPLLPAESWREAVEASEQYADGRLREAELLDAWSKAELETAEGFWIGRNSSWLAAHFCDCPGCQRNDEASLLVEMRDAIQQSDWMAARAACYAANLIAWEAEPRRREKARVAERQAQYPLFCDILGKPARTHFDPAWPRWNQGCVKKMARVIFRNGQFADLPILADALEEAGCASEAILSHCRREKTHVRGCWVLDGLLEIGFTPGCP